MNHPKTTSMMIANCKNGDIMKSKATKELTRMTNNKLVDFIMNLTEEEVDRIISELPRLLVMLDTEAQPCHPEQTLLNQ